HPVHTRTNEDVGRAVGRGGGGGGLSPQVRFRGQARRRSAFRRQRGPVEAGFVSLTESNQRTLAPEPTTGSAGNTGKYNKNKPPRVPRAPRGWFMYPNLA